MGNESGYILPPGNLERAAQLRVLAETAKSPEGRKQFLDLAMVYERMAAMLGPPPATSSPVHG